MDKYRRIPKEKDTVAKEEEEIRVTAVGSVSAYVARANEVFNELNKSHIVIKATGGALTKAVTLAEVVKRRFKGLHQTTDIGTTEITDEYEPLEEGLDKVTDIRSVSYVEITLSKEQLDTKHKGYQAPIDESLVTDFDPEIMKRSRGRGSGGGRGGGRGGSKGKGKGKGKGKSRGRSSSDSSDDGSRKGKGKGKGKGKSKGKGKRDESPKGKSKGKGKSKSRDRGYSDYSDSSAGRKGSKGKGKGGKGGDKGGDKGGKGSKGSKGSGKKGGYDSWGSGGGGGGGYGGGGYGDSYSSYNEWDYSPPSRKGKGKGKREDTYYDQYASYGKGSSKGKGKGKSSYDNWW